MARGKRGAVAWVAFLTNEQSVAEQGLGTERGQRRPIPAHRTHDAAYRFVVDEIGNNVVLDRMRSYRDAVTHDIRQRIDNYRLATMAACAASVAARMPRSARPTGGGRQRTRSQMRSAIAISARIGVAAISTIHHIGPWGQIVTPEGYFSDVEDQVNPWRLLYYS